MNMIKTVVTIILAMAFVAGSEMVAAAKLADKLSSGSIIVNIKIKDCDLDAAKLCPGLPKNSRKIFMCMMAYEDNLSQSCKLGITEAAMALEGGMMAIDHSIKACEADADKYCLDVEVGEGRIVGCLRENESSLDKQCVTALKETGLWNLGVK